MEIAPRPRQTLSGQSWEGKRKFYCLAGRFIIFIDFFYFNYR